MKKIVALVTVVVLVLSVVTVGAATAILYGDANGDGKINNRDIGRLQQYLADWDVKLGPDDVTTTVTTAATRPTGTNLPEGDALSVTDATALGLTMAEDVYTEAKYYVSGMVDEMYNSVYGVMTIRDNNGNTLTIYGAYSADGESMFDKLLVQPKEGDSVTLYGVLGRHNGVAQMQYGWVMQHNGKVPEVYRPSYNVQTTATTTSPSASATTTARPTTTTTQDLSTTAKILAAAKALQPGESLQKEVTLTGKVLDIETPYDASFDNITVNIRVENVDIKCYRLKGNGAKDIKPNDTITVKGIIKNYNGIIQFDTGCILIKRVAGAATPTTLYVVSSPKAGVAYKFGMVQPNVDKDTVYYLKGGMSGYYMATSSNSTMAIDVYLENTTGGYYLYAMVKGQKQYINMVLSADGIHVNPAYESTAKTVYTYDSAAQTVVAEIEGAPYWFGTRNDKSYTTVGPCKTEYEGFYCKFYSSSPTAADPVVLPALGTDIDVTFAKNRILVSDAAAQRNTDGTYNVILTLTNYSSNWITEETDWVEYTCYDSQDLILKTEKIEIGCIDTQSNRTKTFTFVVPAGTVEVRLTNSKIVYWTEWS